MTYLIWIRDNMDWMAQPSSSWGDLLPYRHEEQGGGGEEDPGGGAAEWVARLGEGPGGLHQRHRRIPQAFRKHLRQSLNQVRGYKKMTYMSAMNGS